MNQLKIALLLLVGISFLACSCGFGHINSGKDTDISELVKRQQYTFDARRALAQNGFSKDLTSNYNLRISPDSIIADLPYYGRAYQAPIDPTKGGISFTSTHFSYQMEEAKKGGWNIEITPKENEINVSKMRLEITANGYANLSIISLHRQPISFYGKIKEH